MKVREPRRTVYLPARLRCEEGWCDATIRNVSSRGMLLELAAPSERGAYIEVRRGTLTMVVRVAWRRGRMMGVRAQDRIDVGALVANQAAEPASLPQQSREIAERRCDPARHGEGADAVERSRRQSAWLQRSVLGACAVVAALLVAGGVYDMLSSPFAAVALALAVR